MINKNEVRKFFNDLASSWDAEQVDRSLVINEILELASPISDKDVLDVACGTGILFPYYIEKNVASITGIDISSNMIDIAEKTLEDKEYKDKINLICGDVEEVVLDAEYDIAVVYNAFPHFPNGDRLIKRLYDLLKPGGRLLIAHGFSMDTINKHHRGLTSEVSHELEDAKVLAKKFESYFDVDIIISDDEKYIVSGIKKNA